MEGTCSWRELWTLSVAVSTPVPTLSLEDRVDEHKLHTEMDLVQRDTEYLSPHTLFCTWIVEQHISNNCFISAVSIDFSLKPYRKYGKRLLRAV